MGLMWFVHVDDGGKCWGGLYMNKTLFAFCNVTRSLCLNFAPCDIIASSRHLSI